MNRRLQELAAHKQVLQGRSTLHRLEFQRDLLGLADSLHWLRTGARAVSTLSAGSAVLGGALKKIVGNPIGGLLALSSGVLLLVRLAGLGVRLLSGSGGPSTE